jgi:hypothetical protein
MVSMLDDQARRVQPEESLDELLRRQIAEKLGMAPEDVTIEFLDELLEKRIYPSARFNIGSQYGGYDNSNLVVLTREELASIEKAVEVERERLRQEAARQKR